LILLDWGGTLVAAKEKSDRLQAYAMATGHAERESISEELQQVLEALTADPKNTIFVVSGKEQPAVSQYFGSIKGLGLGAEHGFYYKWPREDDQIASFATSSGPGSSGSSGSSGHHHYHAAAAAAAASGGGARGVPPAAAGTSAGASSFSSSGAATAPNTAANTTVPGTRGRWQSFMEVGDQSWRESARLIMDIFVQRTYGTYIEQKGNALIWQFSEADPEFGFMQSKELVDHLTLLMAPYPVEVIRGGGSTDGYIEVRPAGASKGLFLHHCMATLRALGQEADFVLTVGDDSSDEPMFQGVAEIVQEHPALSAFAVTVGKKPSAASSYVDDPSAVFELLVTLSKCSHKEKKFFSALDLPSQAKQHALGVSGFAAQAIRAEQQQQQTSSSLSPGMRSGSPTGGPPLVRRLMFCLLVIYASSNKPF
jgi:trehalose-phosphatase